MKFIKLITFLGLSLLSMQCLASRVICEGGLNLNEVTAAVNNQIKDEKNVSTPSTQVIKDGYSYYYIICVTVN